MKAGLVLDSSKLHRVNYTAIAKAADTNEHAITIILKQILQAVTTATKNGHLTKLNFKVGCLKF